MNQEHLPIESSGSGSGHPNGMFRHLMGLLTKAKINDDARHDLVYAWTNGRTSSSKDLSASEIRDLVWKFENHFDAPAVDMYIESESKKQRSIILKIATDTGIKDPHDFKTFNSFMKSHSILKKDLHRYTLGELYDLVKQFRGLQRNFARSAERPGTKAWYLERGISQPVAN